jgi:hypothetical protein
LLQQVSRVPGAPLGFSALSRASMCFFIASVRGSDSASAAARGSAASRGSAAASGSTAARCSDAASGRGGSVRKENLLKHAAAPPRIALARTLELSFISPVVDINGNKADTVIFQIRRIYQLLDWCSPSTAASGFKRVGSREVHVHLIHCRAVT